MAILSKEALCNLALGNLGNRGTVTDIDDPQTDLETIFASWYDITRQTALKISMPNFALARRVVAAVEETPAFGYQYVFEYPLDCLKLLGLGYIDERADYKYVVENGRVYAKDAWEDGLWVRFIRDVEDVALFSSEFKVLMGWELAANVALSVTQDDKKRLAAEAMRDKWLISCSGLNAQENRPVRISHSRFRAARTSDIPRNAELQ